MLRHVIFLHHHHHFPHFNFHLPSSSLATSTTKFIPKYSISLKLTSASTIPPRRNQNQILNPNHSLHCRLSCFHSSSPSSHGHACVVSSDSNYGKKQVISVTPRLYDYLLQNVREPQILRKLREETANLSGSQMQVPPDQAQLLAMLVQLLGAKRCIEVGVYTGYSALAVALVLPESGFLVACERDERALKVARSFFEQAGVLHKVHVQHGLAIDTLKSLLANGEASSYDFAFIDADKRMYQEYFDTLLQLVRVGGVIVVDNVLWHGNVADPLVNDKRTISIRNFNQGLLADARVDISMVPIGDGMTICRKK